MRQVLLFHFLDILAVFFLSLDIDFLFLFVSDADTRKGAMCLFCVPIHKKKKKKKKKKKINGS